MKKISKCLQLSEEEKIRRGEEIRRLMEEAKERLARMTPEELATLDNDDIMCGAASFEEQELIERRMQGENVMKRVSLQSVVIEFSYTKWSSWPELVPLRNEIARHAWRTGECIVCAILAIAPNADAYRQRGVADECYCDS